MPRPPIPTLASVLVGLVLNVAPPPEGHSAADPDVALRALVDRAHLDVEALDQRLNDAKSAADVAATTQIPGEMLRLAAELAAVDAAAAKLASTTGRIEVMVVNLSAAPQR